MLANSGEMTAPCGVPAHSPSKDGRLSTPYGSPSLHALHDVLAQVALDQIQNASIADLLFYPRHQPVVRDRVEIALQVGVHHMGIAFLQQPIDFPQRILASSTRTEAVAAFPERCLKDRFNRHFERRLHDAVLHARYPQRTGLARPLGYIDALDGRRAIRPGLQTLTKFDEISFRARREPLHALAVHPGRSLVLLDLTPRSFQGRGAEDLIRQAEPFASLDAVAQRRLHAVRPDRRFGPP